MKKDQKIKYVVLTVCLLMILYVVLGPNNMPEDSVAENDSRESVTWSLLKIFDTGTGKSWLTRTVLGLISGSICWFFGLRH